MSRRRPDPARPRSHREPDPSAVPSAGEAAVPEELVPLVYEELRKVARRMLRAERPGHSLQPTDLANEALRRLLRAEDLAPRDERQLVALVAVQMRRVLVDHARQRLAQKRGGGKKRVPLDESMLLQLEEPDHVLALEEALQRLAGLGEHLVRTVELRYLGGLTAEQTARSLGVGVDRVHADWRFARAWLNRELLDRREP